VNNSRELEDSRRRTRHFYESMSDDCKLQTSTKNKPSSSPLIRKASVLLTGTGTVWSWGSDKSQSIAGGFEESDECVGGSEVELD